MVVVLVVTSLFDGRGSSGVTGAQAVPSLPATAPSSSAITATSTYPPTETTTAVTIIAAPALTTASTTPATTTPSTDPAPVTVDDAMLVVQRDGAQHDQPLTLWGFNTDHTKVIVEVRADHMAVGLDLYAKYAKFLQLSIGVLPYPPTSPPAPRQCGPAIADTSADSLGLTARIDTTALSVKSGDNATGSVVIHNTTSHPITLETDSRYSGVLTDDAGTIIGIDGTVHAGTGLGATLPPGGDDTIPLIFGTTSCDPHYGYTLPAGTYHLVVRVAIQIATDYTGVILATPPIDITVTP